MDRTFTVMVFNADATNRHEDLSHKSKQESAERLSNYLHEKIQEYSTRMINAKSSAAEPLSPPAGASAQGASIEEVLANRFGDLTLNTTTANPLPTAHSAESSAGILYQLSLQLQSSSSPTPLPPSLPTPPLFNGLVTVSEFIESAHKKLLEKLKKGGNYEGILTTNDYLATYWNADKWQRNPNFGELNDKRYSAVVLEHKIIKKRLLYISVHLPLKDKERQKIELEEIKKLIEDNKQMKDMNADACVIAGDFNMKPSEIVGVFGSDMTPVIPKDDEKTTRAGRSIDNILMSDAIELQSPVTTDRNEICLSHHPLYGVLRFKDTMKVVENP